MPVYTPPALNAVDFALTARAPQNVDPYLMPLTSYTVPALNAVDFSLVSYTRPVYNTIDFELLDAAGTLYTQTISAAVVVVATLSRILTYSKTLVASIISIGTLTKQSLFKRTLDATVSILSTLSAIFQGGAVPILYFQTLSANFVTVASIGIISVFDNITKLRKRMIRTFIRAIRL